MRTSVFYMVMAYLADRGFKVFAVGKAHDDLYAYVYGRKIRDIEYKGLGVSVFKAPKTVEDFEKSNYYMERVDEEIMMEGVAIIFDCGSTNLRVAAVRADGEIVAQSSKMNSSKPQPGGEPGWLIWDVDEIWEKLCLLTRNVLKRINGKFKPAAVIVTTWGADGVLIRRDGSIVYPAISWQCPRTREIALQLRREYDPWRIFRITGYQILPINTLVKFIWLKRHVPRVFEEAHTFLMMPGYISYRLTEEFHIDPTSASTMMAMDLGKRDWSEEMLSLAGLTPGFFPEWMEPGEILGYVTEKAHMETGLPMGLPVVVGGHDTQFAIMAAAAGREEATLSSGTWEILSLRLDRFDPNRRAYESGMIIELDLEKVFWNPQFLMIASAVLEWIRKTLYPEALEKGYEVMVREAEKIPPGAGDLLFIPSFIPDAGPTGKYRVPGTMIGLKLDTGRGQIYRAALEGLSFQLRLALELLEDAFDLRLKGIRIVGGGSKNMLWNRIRANVCGRKVSVTRFKEATVLGASIAAFKGIGFFKTFEEALKEINFEIRCFHPNKAENELYNRIYRRYLMIIKSLGSASEEQIEGS